jgi:hypothetical protein
MYFNVVKTLIFSLSGIKMGWKKFEVGGRILDAIDTTIYTLMANFQTIYNIAHYGLIQHVFIGLQLIFGENFILNIPSTTHSSTI